MPGSSSSTSPPVGVLVAVCPSCLVGESAAVAAAESASCAVVVGGELWNASLTRCAVGDASLPRLIGSGSSILTSAPSLSRTSQGIGLSRGAFGPLDPGAGVPSRLEPATGGGRTVAPLAAIPSIAAAFEGDSGEEKAAGRGRGSFGSVSVKASRVEDTLNTRESARSHLGRDG